MNSSKNKYNSRFSSTIKCSVCSKELAYPALRIPLGPWKYTTDLDAKRVGLDVRDGVAQYGKFCLSCGRTMAMKLSEDYLLGGNPSKFRKFGWLCKLIMRVIV